MEISTDHSKSDGDQTSSNASAILRALLGIVVRVTEFFTMNESDRIRAGIYYGGGKRDR
ncbi:MAG: hypothetical protein JXA25_00395 [Anaerolineales bacterium]|nr:hypothetical protein [Anaerolineales bacterium]